jgi:peptidoglycan/LPS O-acetylase OafA/YrhL
VIARLRTLLTFFAHHARMERSGMMRLECLDGLRGLLAVYVLLGHMAPFAALPNFVQDGLSHGGAAVDVFFMLSGLVITRSLHTHGRAKPFLIARATRIFPVFLLVLAFAIVVEPWSCGFQRMPWIRPDSAARTICVMAWPHAWLPEIMAHVTMTHGLFPNGILPDVWVSFLGSAWSLSTEWQFYLLALLVIGGGRAFSRPFVAAGSGDYLISGRIVRPQTLYWMLLGLAVAGVAWRLSVPETWQFSRAFLLNKGHSFALGVASEPLVRRQYGALRRYGLVLAATLAICATQGQIGKMLPPLVWTLCLMIQMLPAQRGPRAAGWLLRNPTAQYFGTISYCLYLVNEPIHKLTAATLSHVANGDAILFTLLWLPAAIGLPILASIWLHTHVETPTLVWGRTIAERMRVTPAAQQPG